MVMGCSFVLVFSSAMGVIALVVVAGEVVLEVAVYRFLWWFFFLILFSSVINIILDEVV